MACPVESEYDSTQSQTTQTQSQTTQTQSQGQNNASSHVEGGEDLRQPWGRLIPVPRMGAQAKPELEYELLVDKPIELFDETFRFGRAFSCNFQVTKRNASEKFLQGISREHFMLTRDTTSSLSPAILHDLSHNGTFVNMKRVGKGKQIIIENNDTISSLNLPEHPVAGVFIFMDLLKNEQGEVPSFVSDRYFISRLLGTGACGTVKMVYDKFTCGKFAMKTIVKKQKISGSGSKELNDPQRIANEIHILRELKNPFIVTTREVLDTPKAVYIFLELMEDGELFQLIENCTNGLGESLSKLIFYQMALAVRYLHGKGVTHRDIKPENVLFKRVNGEIMVKLTDFGLSKLVDEESYMKTMCGTLLYVAPEVLLNQGVRAYSSKVDLWSLGVILFICLFGYLPFCANYQGMSLQEQITTATYPMSRKQWRRISVEGQVLVQRLLTVDPDRRMDIDELLRDPWMQDKRTIKIIEGFIAEHRASGTIPDSEYHISSTESSGSLVVLVDPTKSICETPVQTDDTFTDSPRSSLKRNLSECSRLFDDPPSKRACRESDFTDNSNESQWSAEDDAIMAKGSKFNNMTPLIRNVT